MTTEPVVNRHLDWMRSRYLSRNTIQARRVALRSLTTFMGGPILYATHEDLSRWMLQLSTQVAQATLRGYLSHSRSFYEWCLDDQLIDRDPTARLRGPAAPRYLPRPLGDDDFGRAMDSAPDDVRIMFALAGWAGLRAVEIAGLDWQNVDLRRRQMRVTGKGRKERTVHIADELADLLEHAATRRGPVVRRRDGSQAHLEPHRVSHLANAHLHSIGVRETLHSLRHRLATRLLDESGGDLRLVQDVLGHESPATTAVYTRVRPTKMREAIQKAARLELDSEPA